MSTLARKKTGRIAYYREVCQKGSSENYLFDKYVFRHFSIFLTILFIKLGVQPNTATFLSLMATVGSCFFLISNDPLWMMVGVALIFTYYTLDHVDGELARYYIRTGQREPALSGQYFDVLVHSYSSNIMLFFLGVSVYHQFGYWWAIYVGFIGCLGASTFPNLVAARVLMQKVVISPDVLDRPEAAGALRRIERKEQQVEAMQASLLDDAKLKKIIAEAIGFPGLLILIMLAVTADAILGTFEVSGFELNGRLLLIGVMAFLHTVKTFAFLRSWMRLMRPIR